MPYFQIPLKEESRKYTAFLYKGLTYRFCVLPYGLSTSVGSFTRCINLLLGPEILTYTTPYVDDLIVASRDFDEHVQHLDKLFKRLIELGLTIKFSKTLLCRQQVPFLGHILTLEGIRVDPNKIKSFIEFPRPKHHVSLQEFLGMCVYLQRYHAMYAQIVAPLYLLLKKHIRCKWTDIQTKAFEQTKLLFLEGVLFHPILGERFFMETDSSSYGLGALIYQLGPEGERRLISCASRTLKSAERNYSVSEQELLAIVFGLSKFRYFIAYSPLTIRTDHKAHSFLLRCRLPSGRLTRRILAIQEYNFGMETLMSYH
jgi:hypothetical protein